MMTSTFIRSGLLISILMITLQFIQIDLLFLRDNIQHGQLWRLWTGNLVHSNYYHLTLNLAGFWLFLFIFNHLMNAIQLFMSIILLSSGVGLGLYFFNPELYWYAGFSGVLYGLYIIGATYALLDNDIITGLSIIILIPTKIIWDHLHATGQVNAALIGVPVSTDSHIYGISSAFLVGLFIAIHHYQRIRFTH